MNDTMRRNVVALALAFVLAPVYAQQPLNPPLKNWAAPLYWAPTPREAEQQRIEQRIAHPESSASAIAQAGSIFTPPGPMTFIAITPCRVMDTRNGQGFTGAFGPPSLVANTARVVPIPTSTTCSIPATAGAYSLNITVVPPGPMSFLSVWPAGAPFPTVSTLNDPVSGGVIANAAIVVAGTSGAIQMFASNATDVIIDINGYYSAPTDGLQNTGIGAGTLLLNTTGTGNTASGYGALQLNTTGSDNTANGAGALVNNNTGNGNTANGFQALQSNTTGNSNTASGSAALGNNTTGGGNTASGSGALQDNTTGSNNTASGIAALTSNTIGGQNTATGSAAPYLNTTGFYNTASGYGALQNNTSGGNNIAIGHVAAYNVSGGNSNNIHIGSPGVASDGAANSGVIRIGASAFQTSTYIAGISGATPGTPNLLVCVDANGQLGTTGCSSTPSSQRFKEQIADMGDSSSKLLQMRPATFLYKPEYDDGSHALQYGLIAEEVAKLYPDMVGYDKDDKPSSVKYQTLAPMLLNELQKQAEENRQQTGQIRSLEERLAALEALLSSQTSTAAKTGGSQ